MSRMAQHDPLTIMRGTSKPFSLVLCCLAYMGIQTKIIRLPIIKVLESSNADPLEVSEAGVTILGGGYIFDHGMNSYQAGTQGLANPYGIAHKTNAALDEITFRAPWVAENLAESQAASEAVAEEREKERTKADTRPDGINALSKEIKEYLVDLKSGWGLRGWATETAQRLSEAGKAKTLELHSSESQFQENLSRIQEERDTFKEYSWFQSEFYR